MWEQLAHFHRTTPLTPEGVARGARPVRLPWTTEGPGANRYGSVCWVAVRIAHPTGGSSPPEVFQDFGLENDLSVINRGPGAWHRSWRWEQLAPSTGLQPSPSRRQTVTRAARDVRMPWTTEGPGAYRYVSVCWVAVRIAHPTGGSSPPEVVQDFGLGSDLSVTNRGSGA